MLCRGVSCAWPHADGQRHHAGDLSTAPSAGAANITYYIQAERVLHDFAPGGLVDLCTGLPLDGETSVSRSPIASPHTFFVGAKV